MPSALLFDLDVPPSHVHWVDSVKLVSSMLEPAVKNAELCGLDTETRPCFAATVTNPTSLLQLAIRAKDGKERVFLIDLLTLMSPPSCGAAAEALRRALQPLRSSAVVVLGHGVTRDLIDLNASYRKGSAFQGPWEGVLELSVIHKWLEKNESSPSLSVSLGFLCLRYLHCDLDKRQQCSNWGTRPLSDAQLTYAAADALVCLRIYDVLVANAKDVANGPFSAVDHAQTVMGGARGIGSPPPPSRRRRSSASGKGGGSATSTTATSSSCDSSPSSTAPKGVARIWEWTSLQCKQSARKKRRSSQQELK
jgi:hypothetical protein